MFERSELVNMIFENTGAVLSVTYINKIPPDRDSALVTLILLKIPPQLSIIENIPPAPP